MGMTEERSPEEHARLAAEYREARDAIGAHRRVQAAEELALGRLLAANRGRPDTPEVTEHRARVARAVADVEWCRAVTVAAGEVFKGVAFDDVPHSATDSAALRTRALAPLEQDGT